MTSVEDHYRKLLAGHYTWMRGSYDEKVAEYRDFFERIGVSPQHTGRALDLGAGSGFQSVALADLGFEVLSIDTSETLLEELRGRMRKRRIRPVPGDIRDPDLYAASSPFEIVVCMGDTLTHLDSSEEVARLISDTGAALQKGGTLILEFRDLSTGLEGVDRAIPVRLDEDKIMTTFLEYEPERVNVHDMILTKETSGWTVEKSAYAKLRLGPNEVLDLLNNNGVQAAEHYDERGFSVIVSRS